VSDKKTTVNKDLLVVLKSGGLGEGEADLSGKLMSAFLETLLESGEVPARMICINSAVFLATEGSPVADILKGLEDAGTEILSCGTCLAYYGRKEKLVAGRPTDMRETVKGLVGYSKVISL